MLLFIDPGSGPDYDYAALRIEPDRLSLIVLADGALEEFDSVTVETEAGTWYTVDFEYVDGGPDNAMLSLTRTTDKVNLFVRQDVV